MKIVFPLKLPGLKKCWALKIARIFQACSSLQQFSHPWGPKTRRLFGSLPTPFFITTSCKIHHLKNIHYFESNWLDIENQINSILRIKLTRYWRSNWLSISSQFQSNILQLLRILNRILVPSVTQLFRSKWLHFFLSVINAEIKVIKYFFGVI